MILRVNGPIYYANALTVRDRVKAMIEEAEPPPRFLIFEASGQDQIDLTSVNALKSLIKELQARDIRVYLADVHAPMGEFARRAGMLEVISEDQVYATVDLAIQSIEENSPHI